MVMEAATLSNPQRKFNVVPVQKSLSLPSYARAGGEGIDHQLIFAALEQKEKVRRKSKIFTREKSSRQTVFCLPLPTSSNRCRETSLSSDTSCSSLEYQKPLPKTKKEDPKKKQDPKPNKKEDLKKEEHHKAHRLNDSNDKLPTPQPPPDPPKLRKDVLTRNAVAEMSLLMSRPTATTRLTVAGSSDSMDRSSRSSNDSLGRREWLVAVKARVEAAREKIGNGSSSEEESTASMTRYNSDGLIHKSGRDSTSRPSRYERRVRRRSQDEVALKKLSKKGNLSLCLGDAKTNMEVKTDFCPSPNVPDVVLRKNYFSDYPSRESAAKSVQARIRHIEDEERKRRSGSDFFNKFDPPSRQSPLDSPAGTETRRTNGLQSAFADAARSSPVPRSSQAPTPPPRSPKSITFVNKAFLQHQMQQENSLERKRPANPAGFHSKLFDQLRTDPTSRSEAVITPEPVRLKTDSVVTDASEKQKIRELICSRRKTCGNFDFMDENMFSDLSPLKGSPSSNATSVTNSNFPSVPQMKKLESKGYFSSSEVHCPPVEDPVSKLWKSKWQENDQRREYMFNSLESKRKYATPSWSKWKNTTSENDTSSPQSFSNYKSAYTPKEDVNSKTHLNVTELINQLDSITKLNSKELSSLNIHHPSDRLSKSEANIALKEKAKLAAEVKENNLSNSSDKILKVEQTSNSKSKPSDKISATANLESAMEELESVYQSLKISSDNLSDKGNTSNSLDDKDLRKSKFSYNSNKDDIGFKRRSSVCESNLRSLHIKSDFQDLLKMTERKHHSPMPDLLACLSPKENITEQLSIDELFNDLTQQLDLEQKLLKDPRDNRTQTKATSQATRFPNPRPSNPQPSQISIRKEFFDNLSKGHQDQSKRHPESNEPQPPPMAKKKYKAVRSLSENISMLMAAANPSSPKHNSVAKTSLNEDNNNSSKTAAIEQYYERARDPSRRDLSCKSPDSTPQTTNTDEIRHIRVSMDTAQPKPVIRDKLPATKHYARLSSAVCSTATQITPKQDTCPNQDLSHSKDTVLDPSGSDYLINSLLWEEVPRPSSNASVVKDPSPIRLQEASSNSCNSKDTSDVLEEGLEKLLNRLLGDVPERPQSSLLQSTDVGSPTPPPGKPENVKLNWNILPSKMDIYATSNAKNKISSAECKLRNERAAENVQKVPDYRQNNNGVMNQMSFIPVYTKKTNMCHNNPKSEKSKKETDEPDDSVKGVNVWHSPPVRQKGIKDQTEKLLGRTVYVYPRRRSVGFEDMTSTASNYGCSSPYEKRLQVESINSILPPGSVISRNRLDSEVDLAGLKDPENRGVSGLNCNTEMAENENSLIQSIKSSGQLKDKSSKRKSSLNRIDFVDFPSSCSGKINSQKSNYNSNSSSDEGSGSKSQLTNSEFLSTSYKRKHNSNQSLKTPEKKAAELTTSKNSSSTTRTRANILPKTLQSNPNRVRHHKRILSATAAHLQKFSHSAGELETLTDASEVANPSNKICLSAQEFDAHDSACSASKKSLKKLMPLPQSGKLSHTTALVKNTNENASHMDSISLVSSRETESVGDVKDASSHPTVSPCTENEEACKDVLEPTNTSFAEQLTSKGFDLNGSMDLKHIDSRSEDESDLMQATSRVENLDISSEKDEQYISAEENYDPLASDSERRPSSILRRKQFEEKRELHGILKPPTANEKPSKTPPSILKHRESSEEKDVWQQGDLHSILKKSTSEEESCNSGPDIRPILKVSTDEESPSGSVRPRPILKKRTSFSEECSYVSYPNSDLKPILKKKTPLSLEEQPRPILKSRRKSEDARSSLSEFVASRPRAYSADMGVKGGLENRLEDLDVKKENLNKPAEYQDL